jgi:histidinol-phosphate/aromatic aminotransferase/cobyric acid decarboxylase-like protein
MNREDIIRMAKEAKFYIEDDEANSSSNEEDLKLTEHLKNDLTEHLERFAKLVAQHEREACAKIAEIPDGEYEVVVACGTEPTLRRIPKYLNWQDIVKAIRARGQK